MYTVGQVVAFFPASYLPDKVGRRWSMFCGNVVLMIGALVTCFVTVR
jgi:MFS family permease